MSIFNRIKKDIVDNYKALIIIVLYFVITHFAFGYVCPFRLLTGIPCPGCGLTRAGINLICLNINKVLFYNPMMIPIAAFIVYCIIFRYIIGKRIPYINGITIILCLALFVLYLYRMYTMFPDKYPMEYVSRNLFSPIYRLIGEHFNIHLFNSVGEIPHL